MNEISHVKDYCEVDYDMPYADFWITPDGAPIRPKDLKYFYTGQPEVRNWVGVKVFKTDVLLPDYLYWCFQLLYSQGLWRVMKVNCENVSMITLKSVDHMEDE